jgi:hypothetical protein
MPEPEGIVAVDEEIFPVFSVRPKSAILVQRVHYPPPCAEEKYPSSLLIAFAEKQAFFHDRGWSLLCNASAFVDPTMQPDPV